jgi:Brp/Blh family beta-carotene 15,15'-monooxygenase
VLSVWWLSPALALLGFLAASVFHFGSGEADPEAFPASGGKLARGLLVVILPLILHTSEVAPIITALGVPAPTWSPVVGAALAAPLVGWNVFLVRRSGLLAMADALVPAACFALLPPLVSFSLYFTAWHAVDHFRGLRHLDRWHLAWRSIAGCLSSWVAIAIFAWATSRWVAPHARWAVVFGFLSAVTAPHMIVVARARRFLVGPVASGSVPARIAQVA